MFSCVVQSNKEKKQQDCVNDFKRICSVFMGMYNGAIANGIKHTYVRQHYHKYEFKWNNYIDRRRRWCCTTICLLACLPATRQQVKAVEIIYYNLYFILDEEKRSEREFWILM